MQRMSLQPDIIKETRENSICLLSKNTSTNTRLRPWNES